MGLIFVRASRRSKAHTRAARKAKKGSWAKRASRLYHKTSSDLAVHNMSGQRGILGMKRSKQLNRRMQRLSQYFR